MTGPRPGSYDGSVYSPTAPAPRQPVQQPPAFQRGLPNVHAENLRPHPARVAPNFLTVAEVAAELRVSKMTVYRLIHTGDLAASRIGRSFRVPERAVDEYVASAS